MTLDKFTDDTLSLNDWSDNVTNAINGLLVYGTYTPTLTNVTVGTGGTNNGHYWFKPVDPLDTESMGELTIQGYISLGTGGGVTGVMGIDLPAGYEAARVPGDSHTTAILQTHPIGTIYFAEDDGDFATTPVLGFLGMETAARMRATRSVTNGLANHVTVANMSATLPFTTWEAGDRIRYSATMWAQRGQ